MAPETALKTDKFLLIAHGTPEEVNKAKDIVKTTGATEATTHTAQAAQAVGSKIR